MRLKAGNAVLAEAKADIFRPDLREAQVGTGCYGFEIDVPKPVAQKAERGEVACDLVVGENETPLFTFGAFNGEAVPVAIAEVLKLRAAQVSPPPVHPAPAGTQAYRSDDSEPKRYEALFTPRPAALPEGAGAPRATPLWPYADFIRRKYELARTFMVEDFRADMDEYLRWYLDSYCRMRRPLRAPIDADALRYMNALLPSPWGNGLYLTRAQTWFAARHPPAQAMLERGSSEGYGDFLAWWCGELAPALGVEDCLVTDSQVDFLRSVATEWVGRPFPLSRFMTFWCLPRAAGSAFDRFDDAGTRVALHFTLFLDAFRTPSLLRFLPEDVANAFRENGWALFDRVAASVGDHRICAQALGDVAERHGFCLETLRPLGSDTQGRRLNAALPATLSREVLDVQVIGYMHKASGLSQAARSSAEVLRRCTLKSGSYNFALDNPQPDDVDGAPSSAYIARSRVNIIHLNPDSLPMAMGYLPDVFSDAYNIGFFFIELNEISPVHHLAIQLVDEIWVASDYNRAAFARATDKPVRNVGLAIADMPMPAKAAEREKLSRSLDVMGPGNFVYLTIYDSFSYPQRKNPLQVIQVFQEAFPEDPNVRLVIKTQNALAATDSYRSKLYHEIVRICAEDPRIRLIDATYPHADIMRLIAAADCYVSLHRSEGFGLTIAEAMQAGTPVICTNASGNMDFCSEETAWLVDSDAVFILPDEYVHVQPGHRWAQPRQDSAVRAFRAVRSDPAARARRASAACGQIGAKYGIDPVARAYDARLGEILRGLDPRRRGNDT